MCGHYTEAKLAGSSRTRVVDLVRIGVVATFVACFAGLAPAKNTLWLTAAAVVAGVCGYPVWREAAEAVLKRRMTMEFSMALAIVAALAIGEWAAALVILDFVLVAEVLEAITVSRGRRAIEDLVALLPQEAIILHEGAETTVPISSLAVGDVIVVRPGSRITARALGEKIAVEESAAATGTSAAAYIDPESFLRR